MRREIGREIRRGGEQRAHDAIGRDGVPLDERIEQLRPPGVVVRVRDPDRPQAVGEPGEVLGQTEETAAVDGHDLVDTIAEDEAAVEHRDFGFGKR